MNEVTLPPGPQKALDSDRVRALVFDAIVATARKLASAQFRTRKRLIYRRSSNPQHLWSGELLDAPYYSSSIWDVRTSVADLPEAAALTSYLWDRGALPRKMHRDDGQTPTRQAWEGFIWTELVQSPFIYLCEQAAVHDLCRTASFVAWRIDVTEAEAAAEDIALVICNNVRRATALCPIMFAQLGEDAAVHELGDNITLRRLSRDEQCLVLSRFHGDYDDNSAAFWWDQGILQIKFEITVTPGVVTSPFDMKEESAQRLLATVDLAKWALTAGANSESGLYEAPIVAWSPSGWKMWTLRRSTSLFGAGSLEVTSETIARSRSLLSRIRPLLDVSQELESILWFLGRSHLASTSRDALLEATIGLESLLVPGPGESTYRLGLHGAAILASVIPDTVDRELAKIYGLRSKAAHGEAKDKKDFERLAPRARYLLAKAIEGVIAVHESNELRLAESNGDLGKAITTLVRQRCTRPPSDRAP